MGLNIDLVSQFAKLTANKKETKKESTAWGEVVEITESGKTFVKLDGSDRVTPVETITEAKVGDRVSVTIKNHAATLTGNTSSPSINADGSTVGTIRNDFKNLSADNLLIREKLTASEGYIAELSAKNVKIEETLEAHTGKFENLEADVAEFERLSSTFATFDDLTAVNADIHNLLVNYATIERLTAERAEIDDLLASKATIADLSAIQGTIGSLDAGVADIKTLIYGTASGTSIHTNFANAVIAQLGDAQIKSAMIQDISASKITAGEIITDNVKVKSADGSLLISGPVLQIGDGARTRIQIGKDASGNYSFAIFNANGDVLFYEDGITGNAIPDKIINNDMVADDANIDANKLDIDKLFNVINNDGSHTLKSSKVKLDEKNQTLDVAFSSLTTKVDGIQIGGINLLKNTRAYTGVGGSSTIVEETYRDLKVRYLDCTDMEVSVTSFKDMTQWSKAVVAEGGAQYTFSFYAKGTKVRTHFYDGAFTVVRAESSQGIVKTSSVSDGVMDFTLTNEWKRYWVTYTVSDTNTQSSTANKNVLLRVMGGQEAYACGVKFEKGNKATDWSPAPEDAESEITTLNSQYHSLNVTIDDLRSMIVDQSQEIEKKADNSIVTTLSTQYSDLNQTVDDIKTSVGQYTTKLSGLTQRITSAESVINQTKESIDLCVTKSDYEADIVQFSGAISSLYDGLNESYSKGRNLLRNTGGGGDVAIAYGNVLPSLKNITSRTNENGVQTLTASGTNQEIYYRFMPVQLDNLHGLIPGEEYTLAGKVRVNTTSGSFGSLKVRSQYANSAGTSWVVDTSDTNTRNTRVVTEIATVNWIDFSVPLKIPENTKGYYLSFQVYYEGDVIDKGSWSGTIELKELKLEKGDTRTPWSLAPEDISGYYSKTQTDARIQLASDSITQTVSETYATKNSLSSAVSEIQQTSDSIKLSVEKISRTGRNLVRGTSQKDTVLSAYPTSGYIDGPFSGKTTIIPTGNEYVISFEAKSTVNNDAIHCYFYGPNTTTKSVSSEGSGSSSPDGLCVIRLSTEWKRYWIKYTQDGAATTSQKNYIVGRRLSGTGSGTVSIRCVKLEEGHDPTPWSAAPEDARSNFANDSSNVTITNGAITFETGTLLINAGNFTLDANGNITATNALLKGDLETQDPDGEYKTELSAGNLLFYYEGTKIAEMRAQRHAADSINGLTLSIPAESIVGYSGIVFSHGMSANGYQIDYRMSNELNTSANFGDIYSPRHIFYGGVRIQDGIYMDYGDITIANGDMYLINNTSIYSYISDGMLIPYRMLRFMDAQIDIGSVDGTGDALTLVKSTNSSYSAYFRPNVNGKCTLGTSSNRFFRLYAANACETTSDRRLKENIAELSDIHSELFDRLTPVQYNLINGDGRIHYGLIAQDVIAAMEELGIDEQALDLVQHEFNVDDTTGELNDSYGLVYNHFISMLIHEVQKLKQEIKTLKGE